MITPPDKQLPLFVDAPVDYRRELQPARTAMRRKQASPIARQLVTSGFLRDRRVRTILDYGCGIGQDVAFYSGHGYEAQGFDPHVPFGFAAKPTGVFDLVTCLFVFNVIAELSERRAVGEQLVRCVGKNGLLVLASRSPQAIASEASTKNWTPYRDGYLSSPTRGTFQRGISAEELKVLIEGPFSELKDLIEAVSADTSVVVFQRNSDPGERLVR
jgi:DNA phosphorothioation-associated putative methyltransferase